MKDWLCAALVFGTIGFIMKCWLEGPAHWFFADPLGSAAVLIGTAASFGATYLIFGVLERVGMLDWLR